MALEIVPNQPIHDLPSNAGADVDFDAHMAASEKASAKPAAAEGDEPQKPEADTPDDTPEVEPAKPAAEVKAKPDDKAHEVTDPDTGEQIDGRTSAGKRIIRLLGRTVEAEKRARAAEARAAVLEASRPQPKPEPAKDPAADDSAEPQIEDYPDANAWGKALVKFELDKALASDRAARQSEQNQRELQQLHAVIDTREQSFEKTHSDYREIVATVQDEINAGCAVKHPTALALAELMRTHELGPAMAYALGKDVEAHKRLAALPPLQAAFELRQLVQDAPKPKEKSEKAEARSSAPPPPEAVQGTSSASDPDPMNMDFDTHVAVGNRHDAQKSRGSRRRSA